MRETHPYENINYSLRRHYVDAFYARTVPELPAGCRVLDLGGKKTQKRGTFNLEQYGLETVYVNLAPETEPDLLADAANVPVDAATFDVVICSELLEHVPEPPAVLREAARVLKPGGMLLLCVPFLMRLHGDPYDFGRYTDSYWRQQLAACGFDEATLEKQGLFWSVLADMIRSHVQQMAQDGKLRNALKRRILLRLVAWARQQAYLRDSEALATHPLYGSYTTGFGITARKRSGP